MRRALALLTFVVLVATFGRIAVTRAFSSYYIDYASGSNANAGTKVSPWKSAPGMQQGAGCAGATHSYTHVAGDTFIFKIGVTWPAACFPMNISNGGSSNAIRDSYTVDPTWTIGGTRAIFAGQNTLTNSSMVILTAGNINFSWLDIGGWKITAVVDDSHNCDQMAIKVQFPGYSNITASNMYLHDWQVPSALSPASGLSVHGITGGGMCVNNYGHWNVILNQQSEVSDASTGSAQPSIGACGGQIGIADTKCHDLYEGIVDHDTISGDEFYHIAWPCSGNVCGADSMGFAVINHTNVIEASTGEGDGPVFNNYIHDVGVFGEIIIECVQNSVYNNVISNVSRTPIQFQFCSGDSSSNTSYIYNNTADTSTFVRSDGCPCNAINYDPVSVYDGSGHHQAIVMSRNNISIANGFNYPGAAGGSVTTPNRAMNTTEATTYGFTVTNKYSPSSSDPFTVGQGVNLSASCTGNLMALCTDPSGANWFGGSGKSRGSSFDIGAFQFAGGAVGPPSSSVTAPSNGATISGATVSLTATCTPQSPATCTNTQIFVDGAAFGSGGSVTLDSTRIANGTHTIYAVVTDSNMQTGTASTVTVTVNNVAPGCFTTNPAGSTVQGFTAQTTTVTVAWDETPNSTGTNDTVVGTAPTPATAYSQMSALVRSNTSGFWDAYDGATGTYHAANPAPYVGSTLYHFVATLTFSGGNFLNYSVSETVPSSIVIATGWTPRAAATSLAYLVGISDAGIYDTAKVCNFVVGSSTSLSFAPTSLNFGPQTVSTMMTLSTAVTSVGGSTTFTSATAAGTGFSKTADSCAPNTTASCSITVQFDPPSTGPFSGSLTLVDSATGSPHVIPLSGTGIAASPTISPSPLSLNFGGVRLANPPLTVFAGPVTVKINNPPTTFTSVTPTGGDAADFGVSGSSTCVGTVSAPTCSITASFSPSRIGAETTTLVISSSDATNSPQNVTLTATGQIPAPPVAPSNSMFMASVTKTFQVPLTINGLPIGTVPFDAKINFICADCDPVKQTCGTCTAQ